MKDFYLSPTFLLACAFSLISAFSIADSAEDHARLEKIKRNIAELKQELESTRTSRDQMMKSLEKTEKEIGELSKQADELKTELNGTETKLKNLREERSQLEQQKRAQQTHVAGYVNSAYRLGQQSGLRLLLNQQNPATVTRNLKYFDYLIAARSEKISRFVSTIERLTKIEPEIAYQTSVLQKKHSEVQTQRKAMSAAQSKRKSTLASLNSSLANKKEKLETLEADRSRLQKVLARVRQWVEDIDVPQSKKSFAKSRGLLPWPAKGKVIKQFGASRVTNKLRWEGILIRSPPGAPVLAVHHGRVVFSDYLRGHGLLIIVDHGGGYLSLYAHNQALYKELGEWVETGETIAAVGNSGGQQESALYFELRQGGKPTNPRGWFRSA